MKILYVMTSLENGGAQFITPEVIETIRRFGHEVSVFACEPRDRLAEGRFRAAGIPVELLSDRAASKLESVFQLLPHARRMRPDVIWTSLSAATFAGQVVGRVLGIPVVSWKHSAKAKSYIRWLRGLSRLWIADSSSVADYLVDDMGVNPGAVATWPLFRAAIPDEPAPAWTGAGPVRIGSVGRLVAQKGFERLVRSIDLLRSLRPDLFELIEVTIAGEGARRDDLQSLIDGLGLSDRIRLLGFVEDVPAYLGQLHLYVQLSTYEGMCIAAHEAMAAGLPIISTSVGELSRSVDHGRTGFMVDDDVEREAAEAIARFLDDPAPFAGYGRSARAMVASAFGQPAFETAGRNVLGRIQEVVGCG